MNQQALNTCIFQGLTSFCIKVPEVKNSNIMVEAAKNIISHTTQKLGVNVYGFKSKLRDRDYVNARRIAIYLICTHTTLGIKEIGLFFNYMHHSTVIYHRNRCIELINIYRPFRVLVNTIETELQLTKGGNGKAA